MKLKIDDFVDQLSEEFGLSKIQVRAIISEPFKFITNMVRAKEPKSIRLHNFGILFPKKSAKFDEVNRDSSSLEEQDKSNTGDSRESQDKIRDLSEV